MSGVWRPRSRAASAGVFLPLLCRSPASAAQARQALLHTDWRAQAEHGGYYQAVAAGIYRKHGIEVRPEPGGPSLNTAAPAGGRVDMVMSNSSKPSLRTREAPSFTIAAIFQKDPQVLIGHHGSGFTSSEAQGPAR